MHVIIFTSRNRVDIKQPGDKKKRSLFYFTHLTNCKRTLNVRLRPWSNMLVFTENWVMTFILL